MNVIIIDDYLLVCIVICNFFDSNGIIVVVEFDSGVYVVQIVESMQFDLFIVDVDILEFSGIEVLEQLCKCCYQGIIIIIFVKNELFYGKCSVDCGVNGFVSKKEGMNNIFVVIDVVNNGYSYFFFLLECFCIYGIIDQNWLDMLLMQEMKVFCYIFSGVDYIIIGSKMNISNKMVSIYKVCLMDKLGCSILFELYDFV